MLINPSNRSLNILTPCQQNSVCQQDCEYAITRVNSFDQRSAGIPDRRSFAQSGYDGMMEEWQASETKRLFKPSSSCHVLFLDSFFFCSAHRGSDSYHFIEEDTFALIVCFKPL